MSLSNAHLHPSKPYLSPSSSLFGEIENLILPGFTPAELSNFSKSYISQVKHGKRPPSRKLIEALSQKVEPKRVVYLALYPACFDYDILEAKV